MDWDIASAYEAMARANLTAGDLAEVAAWKAKATAALDGIADKDDREVIEGDLANLLRRSRRPGAGALEAPHPRRASDLRPTLGHP